MAAIKVEKVLIVGAGVAGLTAADRLTAAGIAVDVLEEKSFLGGLASTSYIGDFFADAGPHRFHTADPDVLAYIKDVLGGDFYTISRLSGVRMFNRYHSWPLTIGSLLHLPLGIMLRASLDLFHRPKMTDQSFRSHVLSRYGNTLYKYFFKEYTEKFIKLDPAVVHADWAKGGLDRAVIDKRMKMDNLFDVARRTLFPKPVKTEFIYPKGGGIDVFAIRLAERITGQGGRIHLNTPVSALPPDSGGKTRVLGGGKQWDADLVLWTAPLPELAHGLGLPSSDLRYLTTIFYQIICDCPAFLPYQWCYFGDSTTTFCRLSITSNLSPEASPEGRHIITAEVTGLPGEDLMRNPQRLRELIISDLYKVRALPPSAQVTEVHTVILDETYPIYALDYPETLAESMEALKNFPTYIPLGRTGTFWYNNMDHSIMQAMQQADEILSGRAGMIKQQREFWA